jgi:hypothetical protein
MISVRRWKEAGYKMFMKIVARVSSCRETVFVQAAPEGSKVMATPFMQ